MSQAPAGPAYHPGSRRPIAEVFRRSARGAVRLCVRLGIHADVVSYASMVAAGAAAACFWLAARSPWLLLAAPLLCYVRLWLNMLDGMVALESGKASRRGEILNELPDRISDVAIFVGVAHSGLCSPLLGYWSALGAVFTAYVGTLGQAVAGRREFHGWMAKPHRMVALHAGAWVTWWLGPGQARDLAGLSVLGWTCAVVILGCAQTSASRLVRTLRLLRAEQGGTR